MSTVIAPGPGPAEGQAPPHNFTANRGYENLHPSSQDTPPLPHTPTSGENTEYAADNEDSIDDLFEEEDDEYFDDLDYDPTSGDLTKSYNRQRKQNAQDGGILPRTNPQKPLADAKASVDDQITNLAKHAGKIKLEGGGSIGGDNKKMNGKDKSDRATSEQVLDPRKEANVYGAASEPEPTEADPNPTPLHRAIKVYKTSILVFKDRDRYVTGEHRFRGGYNKGNNRAMVKVWAEKEYRNLKRLFTAGIPCPEPVYLRLHVLVMEFLGDKKGWAAPRLRDAVLQGDDIDEQYRKLYLQCLGLMKRMYQTCKLVHADLSEYNILYHLDKLFIIDVSQSVEHDHPRALEFLRMDIKNVSDYFRRQNVDVLSEQSVFQFLTSNSNVQEPALSKSINTLFENRPTEASGEAAAAEQEVSNQVFRQQFMPQTLDQVYDIERDAEKIHKGQKDELIYRSLLADKVPMSSGNEADGEDTGGASLGTGSDSSDEDEESDDESRFEKGQPRGKRFEDKDAKREHKKAVKEEKREKRKEKIPKHLKKKLVSSSAKHKH